MHLTRMSYTKKTPADAKEFKDKKGNVIVRWKGRNGLPVEAVPHPKKPGFVVVTVDRWFCEYRDEHGNKVRVKLYRDRAASEREMIRLADKLERIACGDISPHQAKRGNMSLDQLIDEWAESIRAGDVTEKHHRTHVGRVRRICKLTHADRITDLTPQSVGKALKQLRDGSNFSPTTSNHYLTACKGFTSWSVKAGYLPADPLIGAEKVEFESRRTFERRSLADDELADLVCFSRFHSWHRATMSGPDRSILYLVAAYTGFRAGELATLTRESFSLEGDSPTISLPGRATKNKKQVVQPIPVDVAAAVREWLKHVPAGREVWPGGKLKNVKANSLLQADLAEIGIPAKTRSGIIDFHALRTTYGTILARSGIPIQHAQRLMRHSTPDLMMRHYAKLGINDLGEQVAKLPKIG